MKLLTNDVGPARLEIKASNAEHNLLNWLHLIALSDCPVMEVDFGVLSFLNVEHACQSTELSRRVEISRLTCFNAVSLGMKTSNQSIQKLALRAPGRLAWPTVSVRGPA
jgi:hypothetical protein